MRSILLAGAGAIALVGVPAAQAQMTDTTVETATSPDTMVTETTTTVTEPAQPAPDSSVPGSTNAVSDKRGGYEMTPQQTSVYKTWTVEKRADYDAWPVSYQEYYWTLDPGQQQGYWALTPDQRGKIYQMSPEQRAIAWKSVRQQLAGATPTTPPGQANPPGQGIPTNGVPNPKMANQAVQPAMPKDESYQGGPYKGALTPPPADAMNKDYPVCKGDVQDSCVNPREAGMNWGNRPLDHWPGQPASEMKEDDLGG
ncbi:hypothetical protein B2G71_06860 [Novosphingobium sp. PC22D]|uniref:hypothetical protein n=1 Tax=Novosphingobium sp. PC22D TaxID=1962403 RepID=UPI000BFAC236|nr:hypothetical protein [Novosphingobium sp. PC22D]PEQ13165.1 hypothetical protein B2G71_06860 [Novosphingobium sp. PC22D]